MSQQEQATPDLLARLKKLCERSNEKLGVILDNAPLDEIRAWARRQLSEGARKLDLSALLETRRRIDRMLERLVKGTRGVIVDVTSGTEGRRVQGETGERVEDVEAEQDSMPPTSGKDRGAEERLRAEAGAEGQAGVGQEQTELDVQISKFDIARTEGVAEEDRQLPWGYAKTRVTVMFIDADRLFTYWEVTDPAIENARAGLGPGGSGAWLNLRVYDVSGRIFDGTNAHSYFDQKIERTDRQWFFHIGKPGSSAVVEAGMKSSEGYFVKIARSGRVDFPRREPSTAANVEWLTVRPDSGEIGSHVTEHHLPWREFAGGDGPPISVADWEGGRGDGQSWDDGAARMAALLPGEAVVRRWDWQVIFPGDWQEMRRTLSWEGPLVRTSWEAGPFFVPVELPSRVEEYHTGDVRITTRDGSTRVTYGPWKVVIRGLGARAERRVLGAWEMTRTWTEVPVRLTTSRWAEGRVGAGVGAWGSGASEMLAGGASEILLRGASEIRLGGASEVFYLGASEVQLGGASETLYLGASEVRLRGASEIRLGGATEWSFRGASERVGVGASEVMARGASELRLGGASEMPVGRGSEARLADAGAMEPEAADSREPGGSATPSSAAGDGGRTGYPPIRPRRAREGGGSDSGGR